MISKCAGMSAMSSTLQPNFPLDQVYLPRQSFRMRLEEHSTSASSLRTTQVAETNDMCALDKSQSTHAFACDNVLFGCRRSRP